MITNEKKTVAFFTLGCKLNFAETSSIVQRLQKAGYVRAKKNEPASVCIINTCSVTESAEKKCRQTIHKLAQENPDALIVVTGCYAQLKPNEIKDIPHVDIVVGSNDKLEIPNLIKQFPEGNHIICSPTKGKTQFFHSCSNDERTRYFLKVQDGCDYFCSYCTIPFARGRSRNGSIDELVKQAQTIALKGGKEIVLTGVNIGDFGKTTGETFFDLIKAFDRTEGIERFRISSIEPDLLSDEMIDFLASSARFAPHFHLPLQAGNDEVLKLMHRRYDTELFAHKIEKIKAVLPDAFIGVDVIVGMRGETDAMFESSKKFIEQMNISQLHVFPFSERANTQALTIDKKVNSQQKKERSRQLLELSEKKLLAFYRSQIGSGHKVLWESTRRNKKMFGFTENYIKVESLYNENKINNIEHVILKNVDETDKKEPKMIV